MGGFCGFTGYAPDDAKPILTNMLDTMAHRGQKVIEMYCQEALAMGFRSRAIENFQDDAGRLALVFYGEIYNQPELRALLEAKGHTLPDASCTQILLHMYAEYGVDMLTHLRGAFAFALYDTKADKLFCARDPFGVKPFYYMRTKTELVFGSEIKSFFPHPSFTPKVNTEALAQYLTFQYSVLNETFFQGVCKLPPGHYFVWEKGSMQLSRYNSHMFTPEDMPMEEAIDSIDNAVQDAVARSMHADDEETIGAFLSGGVDSSYVASLFSKHGGKKTFTVGFDYQRYNETTHAKNLTDSLGIENISKIISTEEYWDSLPSIQFYMDEPLADPAAVAFYFACREAAQHVTTAFSGEGADEFFGGYNIYKEPLSLKYYTWLPLRLRKWLALAAQKLPRNLKGRNYILRGAKPVEARFIGNAYIFTPEERDKLLKTKPIQSPMDITRPYYEQVKHEDDSTKMQFLDINLWLPEDILLQADKMSMAHGLKLRVPLMDKEVFKAASRLPVQYRVTKQETKVAFREAAARHLPPETAWRKKLGFPVPIRIWLREEDYYYRVRAYFISEVAEEYFHVDALLALLDAHYDSQQDNSRKIWTIYMFLLWHDEFFGRSNGQ
jgi:asparagine synthase (glutamine-hydrolysing)